VTIVDLFYFYCSVVFLPFVFFELMEFSGIIDIINYETQFLVGQNHAKIQQQNILIIIIKTRVNGVIDSTAKTRRK